MILQFRHKPILVKALQWTGDNPNEVHDFLHDRSHGIHGGSVYYDTIDTRLEAVVGDWIIRDSQGDITICPHAKFVVIYEPV